MRWYEGLTFSGISFEQIDLVGRDVAEGDGCLGGYCPYEYEYVYVYNVCIYEHIVHTYFFAM